MNEHSTIKFEADEQRQHARYKLPLKATIGGKTYDVLDWSVAGIGISTAKTALKKNSVLDVKLMFPFEGMDFALDVKAEVVYSDPQIGRTGMKYVEVSPEQQRLFRYIIDAYLSGDIISANEVLDLKSRALEVKGRKAASEDAPKTLAGRLAGAAGSVIRSVLVTVILLILIAFVGSSILQRIAVVPAQSAFVSIDLTPVVATVSGTVTNVSTDPVAVGDPVATVLTGTGNSHTELSPCDCTIDKATVTIGAPVSVGETLALLRPRDQKPYVVALIDRNAVVDVFKGVTVQVELPDGTILNNAKLIGMPEVTGKNPAEPVQVSIDVGEAAAGLQVGEPVDVRFIRQNAFGGGVVQYLDGFLDRIGNLFHSSAGRAAS